MRCHKGLPCEFCSFVFTAGTRRATPLLSKEGLGVVDQRATTPDPLLRRRRGLKFRFNALAGLLPGHSAPGACTHYASTSSLIIAVRTIETILTTKAPQNAAQKPWT